MTDKNRNAAIAAFLALAGWPGAVPAPLAADASFRRYYRLADGARRRAVLMDAPSPENVRGYIAVAELLRGWGLSAPELYAADTERGLLLIEDFGDASYARLLAGGADAKALYALAVDALVALQRAAAATLPLPDLPPYDEARLLAEAALLPEWYAPAALGHALSDAAQQDYLMRWRAVLPLTLLPPPTVALRDFHIDNLMLLSGRSGVRACGLLDFQDAMLGPASYDLASLVEDARRDVPPALREAMTERYLAAFSGVDRALFARSATILAAQRNAKIIGLFVRLWRRDGKPAYLAHLPRVWRLLADDLRREPALAPIDEWLRRHLPPAVRGNPAQRSAA
jgi:N-acetylmuramate 1-kinase